jgi:hypothetical protein
MVSIHDIVYSNVDPTDFVHVPFRLCAIILSCGGKSL